MEVPDSIAPEVMEILSKKVETFAAMIEAKNKEIEHLGLEIIRLKEKTKVVRKPREKKEPITVVEPEPKKEEPQLTLA